MPKHKPARRRSIAEPLESRLLLSADSFHNFLSPNDVNDDGSLTPVDALYVLNRISSKAGGEDVRVGFPDVNDDQAITPVDALSVINSISKRSSSLLATDQAFALLSGADGARGKAEFERGDDDFKLRIRVQNASTDSLFDVTIDGNVVGTLATDERGRGEARIESRGFDNEDFLDELRVIGAGTEIELVGFAGGVFKTSSSLDDDLNDDGVKLRGDGSVDDSQPGAPTTPDPSLAGDVEYKSRLSVGGGEATYEVTGNLRELKVRFRSASAGSRLSISIGDVVVGEVQIDNRGRGELRFETGERPFPADFPSIRVGTLIKVNGLDVGSFVLDN
ncbi:MAG: dockerin type I domain-containing protein [Pirellulaceae bacterium]